MARHPRFEYPGAVWHITNRGVNGADIFYDRNDRALFLELVGVASALFGWHVMAFVLMTNHFHLLLQTPVVPSLSLGMQKVLGDYADRVNWRYGRTGHLFQGRFKAHLIEAESYLLEAARYIVLNPVRAGLVADPAEWEFSSFPSTVGLCEAPSWLDSACLLDLFSPHKAEAQRRYAEFVREKIADRSRLWDGAAGGRILGSSAFVDRILQLETQARPKK